jgi:cysteinyl-tRNA synthetase
MKDNPSSPTPEEMAPSVEETVAQADDLNGHVEKAMQRVDQELKKLSETIKKAELAGVPPEQIIQQKDLMDMKQAMAKIHPDDVGTQQSLSAAMARLSKQNKAKQKANASEKKATQPQQNIENTRQLKRMIPSKRTI